MTTKPLSSHHESARKLAIRIDGLPIQLGAELGSGGEGSVYEIDGQPSLVAKIYHQLPLASEDVEKLHALVARRSAELDQIAAWPQAILHDFYRDQPCGILMPKIADAHHLHELYGTYNRRRHFPEAQWHHLLLAARNVAAAFHSLHAAGIVVGDVNQGNLLVDQKMCVRFIDCDSFQIRVGERLFPCPVGTPHFTPPEMQAIKLREVERTPDHDRFGMAILIFHLLFVGRHPFAGRFRRAEELAIERAIAERRFAFSVNKRETLVDPPPASLLLEDLPRSVADLFEWAFRGRGESRERPAAHQWAVALEELMKRRKFCSYDASHVYFDQLVECPWCRVEDEGGPAFFLAGGSMSGVSQDRLNVLDKKIRALAVRGLPELPLQRLAVPQLPRPERRVPAPKPTRLDLAAWTLVAAIPFSLAGAVSLPALVAGTVSGLAAGGYLLFNKGARERRKRVVDLARQLAAVQPDARRAVEKILVQHRQRRNEYENSLKEVRTECDHYQSEGEKLQDVLVLQRGNQKDRFLAKHLIQDNVRRIPGLTFSLVSMLESFGVESAADVDKLRLSCIPNLSPALTMELLNWRDQVNDSFIYRPDHGITFRELKQAEEIAVRRFKVSQARRVLTGAKQIDSMADAARYDLENSLKEYDTLVAPGRRVAAQWKDFQSNRRRLERWLNRSPLLIAAITVAAPAIGWALYLLLR